MKIEDGILYSATNDDVDDAGVVVVPDTVTKIDVGAFANCDKLVSVDIPDSVFLINDAAFYNCANLQNVKLGNGIEFLMNATFMDCKKLTNITLPENIVFILSDTFQGCSSLTKINVPPALEFIGSRAFAKTNLKSKPGIYKVFEVNNSGKLSCQGKTYNPDKWNTVRGKFDAYKNGIYYWSNLFESFNHFPGKLGKDWVIYECEIKGESTDDFWCPSLHYCRSLKPVKRLSREEIIAILNGDK